MSRNNNKTKEVRIDRSRLISYDETDPRYNQNIEDSDEYTRNIYPLHFSKRCHNSEEYENMVKYDYPLVSRCWGERYEHCAAMKKYGKNCNQNSDDPILRSVIETGACSCAECAMNLYGPIEDTLGYARIDLSPNSNEASHKETLNRSDFKEQNRSSIYDATRIFKSDGLDINYRKPDVKASGSNMSVNKVGNGLEYNYELDDKYANYKPTESVGRSIEGFEQVSDQAIEGFIGQAVNATIDGFFTSSFNSCLPGMGDKWGFISLSCAILMLVLSYISMYQIGMPPFFPQVCAVLLLIAYCNCYYASSFFGNTDNYPDFLTGG